MHMHGYAYMHMHGYPRTYLSSCKGHTYIEVKFGGKVQGERSHVMNAQWLAIKYLYAQLAMM